MENIPHLDDIQLDIFQYLGRFSKYIKLKNAKFTVFFYCYLIQLDQNCLCIKIILRCNFYTSNLNLSNHKKQK